MCEGNLSVYFLPSYLSASVARGRVLVQDEGEEGKEGGLLTTYFISADAVVQEVWQVPVLVRCYPLGPGLSFVLDPPKFCCVISKKSAQISQNFRAVTACGQRHHKFELLFPQFLSAGPKTT